MQSRLSTRLRSRTKSGQGKAKPAERWRFRPELESLEVRITPAIDVTQIPSALQQLGNTLGNEIGSPTFQVDFERGLTQDMIQPMVNFFAQNNPIPPSFQDYLNYTNPLVTQILDAGEQAGLVSIPYNLSDPLRASPASLISFSDGQTLRQKLGLFLDTSMLQTDVNTALNTDALSGYDTLINQVESVCPAGMVTIPIHDNFNLSNTSAQATIANDLRFGSGGDFFHYQLPAANLNIPTLVHIPPIPIGPFGFDVGFASGGATVGITIPLNASLNMNMGVDANGVYIGSNSQFNINLSAVVTGSVGLNIGDFYSASVASISGGITGSLTVSLSNPHGDGKVRPTDLINGPCPFASQGMVYLNVGVDVDLGSAIFGGGPDPSSFASIGGDLVQGYQDAASAIQQAGNDLSTAATNFANQAVTTASSAGQQFVSDATAAAQDVVNDPSSAVQQGLASVGISTPSFPTFAVAPASVRRSGGGFSFIPDIPTSLPSLHKHWDIYTDVLYDSGKIACGTTDMATATVDTNQNLDVVGAKGDNNLDISFDGTYYHITQNGQLLQMISGSIINNLNINTFGGNDTVTVEPSVKIPTFFDKQGGGTADFSGGSGNTNMIGGSGTNTLQGGSGLNVILGANGTNNTIIPGSGDDLLIGGLQANNFVLNNPGSNGMLSVTGMIVDGNNGQSQITINDQGSAATTYGVNGSRIQVGNTVKLIYGDTPTVTINGSSSGSDFIVAPSGTTVNVNGNDPSKDFLALGTKGITGMGGGVASAAATYQGSFTFANAAAVNFSGIAKTNQVLGSSADELAAYRPGDGSWSLDSNGQFGFQSGPVAGPAPQADRVMTSFSPAGAGVQPVSGDWTGNGRTKIGDFENGTWHLDLNDNGTVDPGETFAFGQAGDLPVPGNYLPGGGIELAVFRSFPAQGYGEFFISDPNWLAEAQAGQTIRVNTSFIFGAAGDRVVVGDWNGQGLTEVGVFRDASAFGAPGAAVFSLDIANHHAFDSSNKVFIFGAVTDGVVIGDWDGSGTSKVGVYRAATAFGAANTAVFSLDEHGDLDFTKDGQVFLFGLPTDKYVTGRWAYATSTAAAQIPGAANNGDMLSGLLSGSRKQDPTALDTFFASN